MQVAAPNTSGTIIEEKLEHTLALETVRCVNDARIVIRCEDVATTLATAAPLSNTRTVRMNFSYSRRTALAGRLWPGLFWG